MKQYSSIITMRARVVVLLVLTAAGIAGVVLLWPGERVSGAAPSLEARPAAAKAIAQHDLPIVQEAIAAQLAQSGLSTDDASAIAGISGELLAGLVLADFDRFVSQMHALGLRMGDVAKARLERHRQYAYRDADVDWQAMSLQEQMRYVWEHPAPRLVLWRDVAVGATKAWMGPPLPGTAGQGVHGQVSMFAPENRYDLIRQYRDGKARGVWISVPVTFATGELTLRLQYIYDKSRDQWLPLRLEQVRSGPPQGVGLEF